MTLLALACGAVALAVASAAAPHPPSHRSGPIIPIPATPGALEQVLYGPLPPDATLALASGVHQLGGALRLNRSHSGITLRGPDNGSAVVSGGVALGPSAWKPAANAPQGVWSAMLPDSMLALVKAGQAMPRQLWVEAPGAGPGNAQRRTRARHPNLYDTSTGTVLEQFPYMYWASPLYSCKLSPACGRGKSCTAKGCNTTQCQQCTQSNKMGLRYDATQDGDFFTNLARSPTAISTLETVVYHGWTTSRHFVTDVRPAPSNAIMFQNPSDRPIGFWTGRSSEGGQRFFVENAEALLDSPGEFFVRATGEVLYYPLADEVQDGKLTVTVWVPQLQQVLVADGVADVTLQNLGLAFSDWDCGGPNHTLPCDMQSTSFQDYAAVDLRNVNGIAFESVNISHHGANAVWVRSGSNVNITQSSIYNLGTGAIRVAGFSTYDAPPAGNVSNVVVADTVMADGGWVFASGTAVLVQGGAVGVTVEHCEIREFAYTAISLGWSWDYSVQHAGRHLIRKNHIHHLGFPRREVGDAMACVYTLGQLNGTVVDGNLCHDVRAYMSGGYGLSQDQGSSNILFQNNVCLRTTGSPHNTHYGVNLTYSNNIFWGGYIDSWVPTPSGHVAPGGIRTSPSPTQDCHSVDYPGMCPDQIDFNANLIGQWNNATAGLFEGDFDDTKPNNSVLRFNFKSNLYWTDIAGHDLGTVPVFGGNSRVPPYTQLTWSAWRALHGGTQDAGSVLASHHPFANDDWATTYNMAMAPDSPATRIGFKAIDTSDVGPRHSSR
eukprot:m.7724 g.7724  ORF g.7724 m.7724 type:complete len:775 (+) comp2472_c0_seq1:60-2384(+)